MVPDKEGSGKNAGERASKAERYWKQRITVSRVAREEMDREKGLYNLAPENPRQEVNLFHKDHVDR